MGPNVKNAWEPLLPLIFNCSCQHPKSEVKLENVSWIWKVLFGVGFQWVDEKGATSEKGGEKAERVGVGQKNSCKPIKPNSASLSKAVNLIQPGASLPIAVWCLTGISGKGLSDCPLLLTRRQFFSAMVCKGRRRKK